jgi:hypothetical protein
MTRIDEELIDVAKENKPLEVRRLLSVEANIEAKDCSGATPLRLTCYCGHIIIHFVCFGSALTRKNVAAISSSTRRTIQNRLAKSSSQNRLLPKSAVISSCVIDFFLRD